MQYILNIEEYDKKNGVQLKWVDNYKIKVVNTNGETVIMANNEGLLSLANHLVSIAQSKVPESTHIHLDEYNSLEEGSSELIIQKIK